MGESVVNNIEKIRDLVNKYVEEHGNKCEMTCDNFPENVRLRREDITSGVKNALKEVPLSVKESGWNVTIYFQELLISGATVEDEAYRIFNVSDEWANMTTYHYEVAEDGTRFYYLESIEECIGEIQRLVMFEV